MDPRKAFNGVLVGNMGYTPEEATQSVAKEITQAAAFGHHSVSNPTLVDKIKNGQALLEPDQSTYYSPGAKGYTDYV